MRDAIRELQFAARRLLQAPAYSIAVLLTLALGIGANTAILSFVHGVLLRPLPYPHPEKLVHVCETNVEQVGDWCAASPANAADWARFSHTLEAVGLARSWPFRVTVGGKGQGVRGGIATPGFFRALRVSPAAGRLLLSADMDPGREHVTLVSHAFWKSQLGGSPQALGKTLDIDAVPYEIVGVLPEGFEVQHLESIEVWIPLWPERQQRRDWRGFIPFARLAEGATLRQAQSEMESLRAQLAREHPDTNAAWGISVESMAERVTRPVRPALLVFLGAVGFVLLIACANVASMTLARSCSRERENAVRLALGADRIHLVRAMLTESLLLSLAGGAAGVLLAVWAVDLFIRLAPAWFPRLDTVSVSLPVLGFTLALCLLASLASGLAPALHSSDLDLVEALKSGRAAHAGRRGIRLRHTLVVAQVALALLLVVGAGLLGRSFAKLVDWRPGFDRSNLMVVPLFSSPGKYPAIHSVVALFDHAVQEVQSLPGVISAGAGSAIPLSGGDGEEEFTIEGRPEPAGTPRPSVAWFDVDPRYFHTLGIPLRRGRGFGEQDGARAPAVAIINETMARRHWPGANPLGKRLRMAMHQETVEIVGVVRDVQPFRPDRKPEPQIYWPFAQFPRWAIQLVVRTTGDPAQAGAAIRGRLARLDPDLEVGRLQTMDELVGSQLTPPRFNMTLSVVFALIALAMASLGVYGLMAFTVEQRRREIGIRLAVGARRSTILREVIGRGLGLTLLGVSFGLAGSLALTRLLGSLLVDLAPTDPLTFTAAAALLLAVACVACGIPARRATHVDPNVVLRCE